MSSRTSVLLGVTILVLAFASGCAIENPFFSMSSDSPVPFFGGSISLPPKLPIGR